MIIVTGTVLAKPETLDELLAASMAHVTRSRREQGCIAHGVYHDAEDPLRLFFYEEWLDRAALDAHFRVPESGGFVQTLAALAATRPTMSIHEVVDASS